MVPHRTGIASALLALSVSPSAVGGQQVAASSSPAAPAAASAPVAVERYEPAFEQLQKMALQTDRVAVVHNLTLRRNVIAFHLTDGKLYVGTPVGGRTVGVVFVGSGSVTFAPPLALEREELKRVLGDSALDSRISAAVFLFTDSTQGELERQVSFAAGGPAGDASGPLNDALDHLVDGRRHVVVQPTLMTALLNGEVNGFFYGHVKREHGEDLMFVVDPGQEEPIELLRGGREGRKVQIVCQFREAEGSGATATASPEARAPLELGAVRIEATIAKGLDFSAVATIPLTARREGIRWVRFFLFDELQPDSLREEAGAADSFFRAKHSEELWVRFAAPLHAGETRSVRFAYHGDLIGFRSLMDEIERAWTKSVPRWLADTLRYLLPPAQDRWTYIKASETWFPRYAPWNPRYGNWPLALVELTFHTPTKYRLASVGRKMDARVEGDVTTTRWVTERPANEVSFNIGELDEFNLTDPRIPPVTVQVNATGHRLLEQLLVGPRAPEQDVRADVANSLAFFTKVFGPPLFERYYATEVPLPYGQAFPGLMYLSMYTFQSFSRTGREEAFRAHEMAHQWWGIGVTPATYRDVWLSEGFAEFSGLWYMQTILHDNDKFFKQLKERREAIRAARNDSRPLALGWRLSQTGPGRNDYGLVYDKGAWVLQMLRNLMIDLPTMSEETFMAAMQHFYQHYRGRRASTEDFQRVVEEQLGVPMSWFFDEWVNGTAIPRYIFSWHADSAQGGHYLLRLRVRQEDVPQSFQMPVPLLIHFGGGRHALIRVLVRGPVTEAKVTLPEEPMQLELNPFESVLAEVKTEGWH